MSNWYIIIALVLITLTSAGLVYAGSQVKNGNAQLQELISQYGPTIQKVKSLI